MDEIVHKCLRFDRFTLDLTRGSLRTGTQDIELRPKVFEVLRYLVENAGRLVPKQELCEAVWPNVYVSDDSLAQCIRQLRDGLGDDAHRLIKTVHRRGYLLDAVVTPAATQQSLAGNVTGGEPRPATAGAQVADRERADGSSIPESHPRTSSARALNWRILGMAASVLLLAAVATVYLIPRATMPTGETELQPSTQIVGAAVAPSRRTTFKDCDVCPLMVELAPGAFTMDSPENEPHRSLTEGPQRRVVIPKRFAVGAHEVTVDQFASFVAETGYAVGERCEVINMAALKGPTTNVEWDTIAASFRRPGFEVSGLHPAVCVNWHDAKAYVTWLARRTVKPYRLASEAEWEYAARAGTSASFSFGDDESDLCQYGKFADLASRFPWGGICRGAAGPYGTAPVGSFKPNPWGLFDVHGNAWEWVEDCWKSRLPDGPTDGSAWLQSGRCEVGVIRGGSFASGLQRVRSAYRASLQAARRQYHVGFRVALSLEPL
jgi:formylglycine-generating enzyme required for sulfatase activity/DNA-binding winged helix-turn-helix (wHTH) protein